MAETESYDVIIAGGGFVGMSLALALGGAAPKGFRVALVDAEPPEGSKADARASALSAASKGLLSVLGVWPQLADGAQAITNIEITDSSLDARRRPHLLGFDDDLKPGESGAYMIENEDLVRALKSAVLREPAIEMLAPDSVTGFAATPFSIQAELASGGRLGAKLLIAADGKRSRLRERAGIKCVGWSYPQLGIVTTVAHTKPHHGKAVQHFLPGGPFAMLPLKGNRTSIVWTEDKTTGEAIMAAGEAAFLAEFVEALRHEAWRHRACRPAPILPARFSGRAQLRRRAAGAGRRCRPRRPSARGTRSQYRAARCCGADRDRG